jgi:hypothetical protein
MMGSIFASREKPPLDSSVIGKRPIGRLSIIRSGGQRNTDVPHEGRLLQGENHAKTVCCDVQRWVGDLRRWVDNVQRCR